MKGNVKKLVLLAILSSLFCAVSFADSAEVMSVKGKVEVSRGSDWIPLKVGDKVEQTEMISTGFQSEAKIKIGDSILQLGALSRVTLATIAKNDDKDVVDVYLNTGAVRSKVNHTADKKVNYTVRNPIAVASVRGTEFLFTDNGLAKCTDGAIALAATRYYNPNQLESGKSADEVASPADGESTAITPATDIAPNAPKGTVVVLAGQSAIVSPSGTTTNPISYAIDNIRKPTTTVANAATTEGISTVVSIVPSVTPQIIEKQTGTVTITITFDE